MFPPVLPVAIHVTTGSTGGYDLATLVTAFHVQPFQGWHGASHLKAEECANPH
jgi:hypothetical protein